MNGDIILEARWQWQGAADVISPFIILHLFICAAVQQPGRDVGRRVVDGS